MIEASYQRLYVYINYYTLNFISIDLAIVYKRNKVTCGQLFGKDMVS